MHSYQIYIPLCSLLVQNLILGTAATGNNEPISKWYKRTIKLHSTDYNVSKLGLADGLDSLVCRVI